MWKLRNIKSINTGASNGPKERERQLKSSIKDIVKKLKDIDPENHAFIFVAIGHRDTTKEEEGEGKTAIYMDTYLSGTTDRKTVSQCLEAQVEVLGGNHIKMAEYWGGAKPMSQAAQEGENDD